MGCSCPPRQNQEKWPGSQWPCESLLLFLPLFLGASGRFEASVIEERRKGAEDLLRCTVHIPALNNSPQLKEFFRVCVPACPPAQPLGNHPALQAAPCDSPWLVFLSCRVGR